MAETPSFLCAWVNRSWLDVIKLPHWKDGTCLALLYAQVCHKLCES